ncbi:MAG: hypothetical protein HYX78_04925 [Armatimonadetes bacterium]|nr:hypothetical protein [Armatimonadota bacterium]
MRNFVAILLLSIAGCVPVRAGEPGELFPAGLAQRKWVRFQAHGFTTPVTGVIYRNGDMQPGMPLGGLGTGFMSLGTDGTLDYVSTIFNAFTYPREASQVASWAEDCASNLIMKRHLPTFCLPFLGISVDGKTTVLSLKRVKGVQSARQIDYWGHYPVADMKFDTKSPVSVELRAWTPFIPGQAEESNIPGAVFEVHLRNTDSVARKGALAFSFHGPRRVDVGAPIAATPGEYSRKSVNGAFSGQVISTKVEGREYAYALGVIGREKLRFGGRLDPYSGSPFIDTNNKAWSSAWNSIVTSLPQAGLYESGASTALDFSLQPGETKIVRFVFAWYAPTWTSWLDQYRSTRLAGYSPLTGNPYINMYSTRFKGAGEVAEYLAKEHETLLNRILAWQQVVYSEKKLPGWLQDSLINVLAVLPQESFWMKSPDPNHWWGDKGFFCVNESLVTCPQQACIANDEFAQWPLNLLFPELGLRTLEAFKHYQKQDTGQTPSTLGPYTEPDRPWFNQQLATDGQVYVHMVDRYRLSTGDDKVLDEWYPSIKAGMKFMFTEDKDGDGLLDLHGGDYLESSIVGVAIHISVYWLSTLEITERMARMQGDTAFAEKCRSWYNRGSKSLEEKLWNESVGSYLLYNDTETGKKSETVLCDQLIGNLWTGLHGLPDVLPPERVRKILTTLERLNVSKTPFGITMAARPNDTESDRSWCDLIVPSYSTLAAASAMLRSGDPHFEKLGPEIVHRTWQRLVCAGDAAWDMPSHLAADGTRFGGIKYYHNCMLWVFPLAVLGQDVLTACSSGGFINRIKDAAR